MASLKVKIPGGVIAFLSVYAPHNLKDPPEKFAFYEDLQILLRKTSTNGPRLIYGDLNARLGLQRCGEQDIIGNFGFGREAQAHVEVPNRDSFMEFCTSCAYCVAQTFFPDAVDHKATYHEPGTAPMDHVTPTGFSMLDLVLVPQQWRQIVSEVASDRFAVLASHHFVVWSKLAIRLEGPAPRKPPALDWAALRSVDVRQEFVGNVDANLPEMSGSSWPIACEVILQAAEQSLPKTARPPNKPWISQSTLKLADEGRKARAAGDWPLEKTLRKQIRRAAKRDRAIWLTDLAAKGDWASLRRLRKGQGRQQGRLCDAQGCTVSTEQRAETFAEHLASVQWRVRPVILVPDSCANIFPPMTVNEDIFTSDELLRAIRGLGNGKAVKSGTSLAKRSKPLL